MSRCNLCFREKQELKPFHPNVTDQVCKSCWYELDRVVGFLEHYKLTLAFNTEDIKHLSLAAGRIQSSASFDENEATRVRTQARRDGEEGDPETGERSSYLGHPVVPVEAPSKPPVKPRVRKK